MMRGTSVTLQCEAMSDPPVFQFRWYLNSSTEAVQIPNSALNLSELQTIEQKSGTIYVQQAIYTPDSRFDYGQVFCVGENAHGQQTKSCQFQLQPAGKAAN